MEKCSSWIKKRKGLKKNKRQSVSTNVRKIDRQKKDKKEKLLKEEVNVKMNDGRRKSGMRKKEGEIIFEVG